MPGKVKPSAEERLIARHFRPLATHPGAFGLADDAAAITPPPGCDLVLTTDGVIWRARVCRRSAGPDCAQGAPYASDLAAKGATPLGFLLALSLPADTKSAWIAAFARGLGEDAKHYGCPLLGGDTDRTPGRRRSPSRHSAPCRAARWYGARAPKPVTSWSLPATSATLRSASSCAGMRTSPGTGISLKLRPRSLSGVIGCHSRATRWRTRSCDTRRRRLTSPMD